MVKSFTITDMDTLKKISSQTFWQLVGKFATSISTLIILGLVTRNYGQLGTGVYTLATIYLGFFYLTADFGINAHVLPRLILNRHSLEWRKLFGFRIMLSILLIFLGIILVFFLPFQNSDFKQTVFLGILSILPSAAFVTSNAFFQSNFLYRYSSWATIVGSLLTIGFTLILVKVKAGMPMLILAPVLGWFVTAGVALVLTRRFLKKISPDFDLGYAWTVCKESWPITLTLLANTLYFRVDAFILTSLRSFQEVGIYNLSYQLFQAALVVPTFIMNGYFPLMIKELSADRSKFRKDFQKAIGAMFLLGVGGTILTFLFSPLVITILAGGKGFAGSIESLNILSLGFPAFFLSALFMWLLVVYKEYLSLFLIYSSALVLNIFLNFLVVPYFSYIGTSWNTTICEYLILILQVLILYQRIYKS